MIVFLEGSLVEKDPTRVVLDVGGVGYEVFIPLSTYDRLPLPGAACRLLGTPGRASAQTVARRQYAPFAQPASQP